MKEKIRGILSKVLGLKEHNASIFIPLSFVGQSVLFFLFSALIINDFDLTGYSSSYLLKTIIIYGLVSLGAFLFLQAQNQLVQTLQQYLSIAYWQIIAATIFFFPLMLLGGRKEMFFWATPFISMGLMIIWTSRVNWVQLFIRKSKNTDYLGLWQSLIPQWTSISLKKKANGDILINCDHVLISGAGTPLGQKILSLIANDNLKNLVLIDSNSQNLEIMQAWAQKFLPKTQVVFILNHELTSQNLKSLFKTYNIKYVFDLDRCFHQSSLEIDPSILLLRNLNFPKLLLDQAIASKVKLVATLSAIPLQENEALNAAQTIIECYAQRLDNHKTRIIPFRVRGLTEDRDLQGLLMQYLWSNTANMTFAPTHATAITILTVIRQLLENPAHHGAVWEITHAYAPKKLKLQNTINEKDGLNEIYSKIQAAIQTTRQITLSSESIFPTSQDGAAIVANCPILETDFDQYFKDIETSILGRHTPTKKSA